MNPIVKKAAAAATLIAAIAVAATPSEARWSRGTAAAVGFGAGALVGAAVASSYYGPRYYYGAPAYGYPYAYDYGYAYEPVYQPPAYVGPNYYGAGGCWISTDNARGFGYYGSCARPSATPIARQADTP
jgi:hypothetical protein